MGEGSRLEEYAEGDLSGVPLTFAGVVDRGRDGIYLDNGSKNLVYVFKPGEGGGHFRFFNLQTGSSVELLHCSKDANLVQIPEVALTFWERKLLERRLNEQ